MEPGLRTYILKRVGFAVLMLVGVSIILFTIMRLAPGGPEAVLIGGEFSQEAAAQIREIDMQRGDLRAGGQRQCFQRGQRDGDRRRVGQPGSRRREHFVGGTVQRRKRGECVAPDGGEIGSELGDGRHILAAQGREHRAVAGVACDMCAVGQRPVHADMAEIQVQPANADRGERRDLVS